MVTAAEEWWLFCENVARLRADTLVRNPLVLRNLTRQAQTYLTSENPYAAVEAACAENATLRQEIGRLSEPQKSGRGHAAERSLA